jgi:hypothetical protein
LGLEGADYPLESIKKDYQLSRVCIMIILHCTVHYQAEKKWLNGSPRDLILGYVQLITIGDLSFIHLPSGR